MTEPTKGDHLRWMAVKLRRPGDMSESDAREFWNRTADLINRRGTSQVEHDLQQDESEREKQLDEQRRLKLEVIYDGDASGEQPEINRVLLDICNRELAHLRFRCFARAAALWYQRRLSCVPTWGDAPAVHKPRGPHIENKQWIVETYRTERSRSQSEPDSPVLDRVRDLYFEEFGRELSESTIRRYLGIK